MWFQQTKAKFHFRRITADDIRYFYVVGVLDQETADWLVPYLREPSAANKCEGLKALLLRTFGLSCLEGVARILHMGGLGDRKPSILMREMLMLMNGHLPAFRVRLPRAVARQHPFR